MTPAACLGAVPCSAKRPARPFGWLDRFAAAWSRAFGIVTAGTGSKGAA